METRCTCTDGCASLIVTVPSRPHVRARECLLFFHKFMDGGIDAVRNPDFAFRADRNRVGLTELPQSPPSLSRRRKYLAVEIQAKNLPGESVSHINVLIANLKRTRQPSVLHFPNVIAVLIKDLNSLIL